MSALLVLASCAQGSSPTASRTSAPPAADDAAPAGTDLTTLVVHDGDLVRADGRLAHIGRGRWEICPLLPEAGPSAAPSVVCRLRLAEVTGLPADVPLDTEVRVEGRIRGGVISASSVARHAEDPDYGFPTTPPCPTPAGGWSSPPGTANQDQVSALDRLLEASSTSFGPLSKLRVHGQTIVLVGTTGDVASAQSRLSVRYHGALCIYGTSFSSSQLHVALDRATGLGSPEVVMASLGADAVYLQDVRMTSGTARALAPMTGMLRVHALIRPV